MWHEPWPSQVRRKCALASAYFFTIVTAYYVMKPVRSSLVISDLGSERLPYLYLLTALILGGLVAGYARLMRRLGPWPLMQAVLVGLIATLALFCWALPQGIGWVSGLFYLWVSLFSVIAVTQFWMVADDLFSLEEAKRCFGIVGASGIAGGIVGGAAASLLVHWLHTADLLLVAVGLLACCVGLLRLMRAAAWREPPLRADRGQPGQAPSDTRPSLSYYLRHSGYLRTLLVLVVVTKAVSTVIDYQFNGLVELAIPTQEARTAFFGMFYSALNAVSLAVQLGLTTWLLNRLGVHRILTVLPLGLAAGLVGLLIVPGLALAGVVALYDRSLSYSLNQTGKEILYVPVPSDVRYQVKPLIDAAAFRMAQGLAGAGLLVAQHVGHLPLQSAGLLALPLIGLWLAAIHHLRAVRPAQVR